jgi:hypothetical protein
MSFINLKTTEKPGAQIDRVELALDSLANDPERAAEHAAALECINDPRWSNPQIASAFRSLGFDDVTPGKVQHYRRKLREGTVSA